jgi:hypothetical protein
MKRRRQFGVADRMRIVLVPDPSPDKPLLPDLGYPGSRPRAGWLSRTDQATNLMFVGQPLSMRRVWRGPY